MHKHHAWKQYDVLIAKAFNFICTSYKLPGLRNLKISDWSIQNCHFQRRKTSRVHYSNNWRTNSILPQYDSSVNKLKQIPRCLRWKVNIQQTPIDIELDPFKQQLAVVGVLSAQCSPYRFKTILNGSNTIFRNGQKGNQNNWALFNILQMFKYINKKPQKFHKHIVKTS